MSRFLLLGCVWLGLLAGPAPARAEPTSDQLHAAVRAYEAGRLEEARLLFEQLHAQAPTARTLRGLGVIAFRQGRFIEAVPLLEASLSSSDKPLTPQLARGVEVVLGDARKQIGRLILVALDPEAEVRSDGHEPVHDSTGALLLAPGVHTLAIARPGHVTRTREIALQAGGQLVLDASLTAVPAAPVAVAPAPAAANLAPAEPRPFTLAPQDAMPAARIASRKKRLRRAGYALLGVGAGALLTSLAATAAGAKRVRGIESYCESNECTEGDVEQRMRAEKLDMLSVLSIGGAALGGACAATGLVLWLTLPSEAPIHPNTSVGTLMLQFRGSF